MKIADMRQLHPYYPIGDEMLSMAVAMVNGGHKELEDALNDIPAPLYTTDAKGMVTYINKSCADFSLGTQASGRDLRYINWKLCTIDGAQLPQKVGDSSQICGMTARAERPDGSEANFRPYATPLFDSTGDVVGAVNILIDITDRRQIEHLRDSADRCRRLARSVIDFQTLETLCLMADEYDEKASNLTQMN